MNSLNNLKEMKKMHIIGVIFVIAVGTLLHFVYEWSGENNIAAVFSAVNESTWEHLKMLFYPMLVFAIAEYFIYGNNLANFVPVKVLSILLGMLTTITLFYTYTGIIGKNYLTLSILTFVLSILVAYIFSYRNLKSGTKYKSKTAVITGYVLLVILIICFVIFTFSPPQIGLFYDPSTGGYGKLK